MTTIAKHEAFGTTCFDMGIFVQMFHSLAHNLTAVTTCERDMFLSHFHVHASYIFYLLVPFYALLPHEDTLFTAQAILTVSGIIPMFLIAKQRNFKGFTLLFACILYLFSNGLLAPCYYHFHENCFLPTLLLWLLYAVERRNYPLLYIMSVLVCIVKEDAPLYLGKLTITNPIAETLLILTLFTNIQQTDSLFRKFRLKSFQKRCWTCRKESRFYTFS